jgi:peptidyl-dipeptidase A
MGYLPIRFRRLVADCWIEGLLFSPAKLRIHTAEKPAMPYKWRGRHTLPVIGRNCREELASHAPRDYTSMMHRFLPAVLTYFAVSLHVPILHAQIAAPTQSPPTVQEAREFINRVNAALLATSIENSRIGWVSRTYITDDTEMISAASAARAIAQANQFIAESRRFDNLKLPPDLAREMMLLRRNARPAPSDAALRREATQLRAQLAGMYGKGKYCPGADSRNCLGIDDLDVRMARSRDPKELLDLWAGWHAIAAPMRPKYARFVELSNQGARELGFADTGALWRSRYDMSDLQFITELERTWQQLRPLYEELHAYVRLKLIQKYGGSAERPDGMIPAHLLGNMWAQEWGNIYDIVAPPSAPSTYDLEASLRRQIPNANSSDHEQQLEGAKALARYGDSFFVSLGFEALPASFYERSQFIRPRDRDVDCHASAWDIDGDQDLRIKMCIHIDADNFATVHHEEGHNEYQRAYRNQPFLFRDGANDGFHEAIGDSIALSLTPEYLRQLQLIDSIPPAEADIPLLLRTALNKVAFLPFGLVIDKWRWQVFSGKINPADYNKAWWALREQYQGVAPPITRTEGDFDPGAKNHIPGNVPYARYYLAAIYQFQFYKAMCEAAGYKGPLNRCSFFGSKAAGAKLDTMLKKGASQQWQITLKEMTGKDHLDAAPLLEYFETLYIWLKKQNAFNKTKPGWRSASGQPAAD